MKSFFERLKDKKFVINDKSNEYTLTSVTNDYIELKNSYELKIIPFTAISEVNVRTHSNTFNEIKTNHFDWMEFLGYLD